MKKLLLTCGVMALLSGANAYAAPSPTPGGGLTGQLEHTYSFTFGTDNTGNNGQGGASIDDPNAVEVAHHTGLFAVATEDKDVVTDELVTINTNVVLNATVDDTTANDFAEASAMGVQTNTDNQDCSNCAEKTDTIGGPTGDGAVNNDVGLMSVNQAAGNLNNQGTLVSASVDNYTGGTTTPAPSPTPVTPTGTATSPGGGYAHAQAEATQYNGSYIGGEISGQGEGTGNTVEAVDLILRASLIQNSFDSDGGLVYANQSTGNNNNQLNELSLAFSARPQGVAIAESDLGQFNTGNIVGESASTDEPPMGAGTGTGINKSAEIDTSFNGDTGVFGVNQAVGNNGNQANIVSVAAVGTNLPGF